MRAPRADGLFTKGGHPTPEMRAKIRAGVNRYYQSRPLSPKQAELEARAKQNLAWVQAELRALRARGIG